MRTKTTCCLTVRLSWDVAEGQHHPRYSFAYAEDLETAATSARYAAALSTKSIRLIGAEVSVTGDQAGPWEPLDLKPPTHGAPAVKP
jgi:hypothetical protein